MTSSVVSTNLEIFWVVDAWNLVRLVSIFDSSRSKGFSTFPILFDISTRNSCPWLYISFYNLNIVPYCSYSIASFWAVSNVNFVVSTNLLVSLLILAADFSVFATYESIPSFISVKFCFEFCVIQPAQSLMFLKRQSLGPISVFTTQLFSLSSVKFRVNEMTWSVTTSVMYDSRLVTSSCNMNGVTWFLSSFVRLSSL